MGGCVPIVEEWQDLASGTVHRTLCMQSLVTAWLLLQLHLHDCVPGAQADSLSFFHSGRQLHSITVPSSYKILQLFRMTSSGILCPSPVAREIPIRNVSLTENTSRRGALMSIGNPSQTFAFQVNPSVACDDHYFRKCQLTYLAN